MASGHTAGYTDVMAVRKLAISLVEDLASDVQEAARTEGVSVSAWLAEAAQDHIRRKRLAAFIADFEKDHGEITEDEMNKACATWPD